jgi:hypothetical protein
MAIWLVLASAVVTLVAVNILIAWRYAHTHEAQGHEVRFDAIIREAREIRFDVERLENHLKGCPK